MALDAIELQRFPDYQLVKGILRLRFASPENGRFAAKSRFLAHKPRFGMTRLAMEPTECGSHALRTVGNKIYSPAGNESPQKFFALSSSSTNSIP